MNDLGEEQNIFDQGFGSVGGIDEAGRGPLAGPVVAVCVLLTKDVFIDRRDVLKIKDSKKLTEKRREELFELLSMLPLEIGVGICDHITIDRINILQASFLAMKKAISALKNRPEYILLDGKFRIPNLSLPQKAIISGDDLVFSIAAASIIAKVTRDRMMRKLHSDYPVYGFNKHKGYGTRDHLMALAAHGPSAIHRRSFDPVRQACETIKNKV